MRSQAVAKNDQTEPLRPLAAKIFIYFQPKIRNAIPMPNATDSIIERKINNGSCAEVGSGIIPGMSGQMRRLKPKEITANKIVMRTNFVFVFILS